MSSTAAQRALQRACSERDKNRVRTPKMVELRSTIERGGAASTAHRTATEGLVPMRPQSTSVCSIPGCHKPVATRGWCNGHYLRWRRHGDPLGSVPRISDIDRFMAKVRILGSGCWEWTATRNHSTGYGHFRLHGETTTAHRASYELLREPIPRDSDVDHLCRNRWCVNPDHLEPVTHRVNTLRGAAPTVVLHQSGLCRNGHAINDDNTCFRRGTRKVVYCRVCRREARAQQ